MAGDRYDFINKVRGQINDEEEAGPMYRGMAELANNLGMVSEGDILTGIARDEDNHHALLTAMLSRLQWPIKPEEEPMMRLFPKTYDDWADLGIDIKAKDPGVRDEVDTYLSYIYAGIPEANDAKRWLVRKARELGIA